MGMYDDEGYDDFDNRGGGRSSGGELRRQLEEALAKNKELTTEVGKLRGQVTTTTLKTVLEGKGYNPALSKFIAKDGVDPSDEKAVDTWLEENSSLFAGAKQVPDGDQQNQETPPGDAAAEFAAFQSAQLNALPADPSKLAEASRLMAAAQTPEEVQAALAAATR